MQNFIDSFVHSDPVDLFGMLASLLFSSIAVVISLLTLRQNSKMIESSTRPQIQIYPVYMDAILYVVIKNYGASEAYIDDLSCSHTFTVEESMDKQLTGNPFALVNGALLAPGHSILCPFYGHKFPNETIHFHIRYHSAVKSYKGVFSFNPDSSMPFPSMYPKTENVDQHLQQIVKELHNISKSKL